MSEKKVWFITGAGRGMGVDIAKAANRSATSFIRQKRTWQVVGMVVGGCA